MTGAGSDSAESVLVPQLRSRSFPVVAQRQVPWSRLSFDHGHSQLQYTMADVPVMQMARSSLSCAGRAVYTGTRPGVPLPSGRERGGGDAGSLLPGVLPPN